MKALFRRLAGIMAATVLLWQSAGTLAIADEAGSDPGATAHQCHHDEANCQAQSINLDLSSTSQSVTANHIASPVNIDVGGAAMTVTQGMALTPAQLIAAYQMARTGAQSLLIGADGAAVGGSFVLGNRLANHISDLVIPTNVSVINRAADLNLVGNLNNSGSIYSVSNNPAISGANISALNILNNQSGLITTTLPTSLGIDLSQYSSVLNLSLSAINNIINSGSITSSGNLALAAGGSIQNIMANPGAAMPVMQAMGDVALNSANIINSGLIAATTGNINVIS
ncbi:MAG: hypothetical protein K2W82_13940, partial [Candidatus Obscuribacterales bacterium]|nr:hypothetical protein [Candidatus Obscuribacterales bacterium]